LCADFVCIVSYRPTLLSLCDFPTRRSSDLTHADVPQRAACGTSRPAPPDPRLIVPRSCRRLQKVSMDGSWSLPFYPSLQNYHTLDRKSTRLNSSHVKISYAVFCSPKNNSTC